jgi:Cysteine dioxygenase type I
MPSNSGRAVDVTTPLRRHQLRLIARAVAACPGEWRPLTRFDPVTRWHTRLWSGADHDVWLQTWLPGQGTGLHDHAGSVGVMLVIQGELEEHVPALGGVITRVRRIPEGGVRPMRRHQVHHVINVSLVPALSVHVYSPPLAATRGYEIGSMGLRRYRSSPVRVLPQQPGQSRVSWVGPAGGASATGGRLPAVSRAARFPRVTARLAAGLAAPTL